MSIYTTADVHGNIIEKFSYSRNPALRCLTEDDVVVVCGDIGLGFNGPDKEYEYVLDWLSNRPETYIFLKGNHDNTDIIRTHSLPSAGNELVKCVSGTLSNPFYGDKIISNVFWVPNAAILDICGTRTLCIAGAKSHDIDNLVYPNPKEKKRIKHYRAKGHFYRTVGVDWWPDEDINIPYVKSLLWDYKEMYGDLKVQYIFTHDCPSTFNDIAPLGGPRLIPTEGEKFLEIVRQKVPHKFFIHGHMHGFCFYGPQKDEVFGEHKCVCLYKEIFKLDTDNDEWFGTFICESKQPF